MPHHGSDVLNVAVIGYGYWGPNLARNVLGIDGLHLAAIVDTRSDARERANRNCPGTSCYSSVDELFANESLDVVLIATPADSHFEIAMRCLTENCHVLVEKPLTTRIDQAEHLVSFAKDRGLQLMVDHTFLYSPAINYVKNMIDVSELGDLIYFDSTRSNLGIFQPDVSVLWDLAVHDVSILLYLVDSFPISISASSGRHPHSKHDAAIFLTLGFAHEFFAHINVSWLSPMKVRRLVLSGRKKTILFDDLGADERLRIYEASVERGDVDQSDLLQYRLGDVQIPRVIWSEPLRVEIEDFRDSVIDGKPRRSSASNAIPILKVLIAAEESLQCDGKRIMIK